MKKITLTMLGGLMLMLMLFTSCSEDHQATHYPSHPTDWNYENTPEFHGQYVARTNAKSCAECHGADFSGGESGVSCYTCHASYPHPLLSTSPTAHSTELSVMGWPMASCQSCHGADFAGGKVGVGCLECHTQPGGPAACNTCHADPPVNDAGLPRGMAAGSYGAHAKHVVEKGYACTECHARVNDLTHTGPLPADVAFANARIANEAPYTSPSYAHSGDAVSGNGSCSANYCHSDGQGGPPHESLPWVGGHSYCTACHALPPAAPHTQRTDCTTCHHNVDPTSVYPDDIRFLDPSLHVNGVVNF
jgi:predicted CxxxxCH...CXXCH cytochrome family protein